MGKIAFIFPGQGAQVVGMGKDIYEQYEISQSVFDTADDILSFKVSDICFTENELIHRTDYTQAALLTTSIALLRAIESKGIKADYTAGLSLGEYSALVANKSLSFEDAVTLVRKRGMYMEEAAQASVGTMAAIVGSDESTIREVLASVEGYADIANFNNAKQIVISGEKAAILKAVEVFTEKGIRAIPLQVSGAFHSNLMASAAKKLGEALKDLEINEATIPHFSNVTGQIVTDKSEVKTLLEKQVVSSVRWEENVKNMMDLGVDLFVEIGPGQTLKGIIKKIDRKVKVVNVSDSESLNQLVALLED